MVKKNSFFEFMRFLVYISLIKSVFSVLNSNFSGYDFIAAIITIGLIIPAVYYALSYDAYTKGTPLSEKRKSQTRIAGNIFPTLYTFLIILSLVGSPELNGLSVSWAILTVFACFYFVNKTKSAFFPL